MAVVLDKGDIIATNPDGSELYCTRHKLVPIKITLQPIKDDQTDFTFEVGKQAIIGNDFDVNNWKLEKDDLKIAIKGTIAGSHIDESLSPNNANNGTKFDNVHLIVSKYGERYMLRTWFYPRTNDGKYIYGVGEYELVKINGKPNGET
jgi:hypothetical protein